MLIIKVVCRVKMCDISRCLTSVIESNRRPSMHAPQASNFFYHTNRYSKKCLTIHPPMDAWERCHTRLPDMKCTRY